VVSWTDGWTEVVKQFGTLHAVHTIKNSLLVHEYEILAMAQLLK